MSHFTVMVRLPASVRRDEIESAVGAMLLPYKEAGCGDRDPPELKKYLQFEEDEDGSLDRETGKRGYWRNPNQKWDWWLIGGRWTGSVPVRPGAESGSGEPGLMTQPNRSTVKADYCRISGIDFDALALEGRADADTFWVEWQRFVAGEKFAVFQGPRHTALDLGLIECKDADELTGKEWKTIKWAQPLKAGVDRFDVLKNTTEAEFRANHADHFNPIRPYAILDERGWREPGPMGWFGCSGATPETRRAIAEGFMPWLRGGNQEDWVVLVDCHI